MSLEAQFLRELNRAKDADRNTRKRGLQKLLEALPWDKASQREELLTFLTNHVFPVAVGCVSDQLEKCREVSLHLLANTLKIWAPVDLPHLNHLTTALCNRINEQPFPESAEELRLQVAELLQQLLPKLQAHADAAEVKDMHNTIILALLKASADSFPAVKRACGELICSIALLDPETVRLHAKPLIKALTANASHQHAKTRIVSLEAIVKCLCCMSISSYHTTMTEGTLLTLHKGLADRTPVVRVDLCNLLTQLIDFRIGQCALLSSALLNVDIECIALLLLLAGDDTEGVANTASAALNMALRSYPTSIPRHAAMDEDVTDGELAVRAASASTSSAVLCSVSDVLSIYLTELTDIFINGADNWTVDNKVRSLRGLQKFIGIVKDAALPTLPLMLMALALHVRDDDGDVRRAAETCCFQIGHEVDTMQCLEVLLPRVLGQLPGSDTAAQRSGALRVLTHLWKGAAKAHEPSEQAAEVVSKALTSNGLLIAHRDTILREALVLLVRALVDTIPTTLLNNDVVQRSLVLALLYLMGKGPQEDETVGDAARRELAKLSAAVMPSGGEIKQSEHLIDKHFGFIFQYIVLGKEEGALNLEAVRVAVVDVPYNPHWDVTSASRIAFIELLHSCGALGWAYHEILLPIIQRQTQPTAGPANGSMEANIQSYASQRGEEVIGANRGEIDVRLGLMAALEGFIRTGIAHWECSAHIAAAAQYVIKHILVPNLIWRVGRVEATIRKVALAAAFGILKAGAISFEALFQIATDLVPLLVSNLDDMEMSPRLMACLGLTVIFERLRGVFSDQSIQEMYPKLIARLDDSSDEVRVAICQTLSAFFVGGVNRECYHNTMVDYMLDQLFIHLDDSQTHIQQAVYPVIVRVGLEIDPHAVLKKATAQRSSHRSPTFCDQLIQELNK